MTSVAPITVQPGASVGSVGLENVVSEQPVSASNMAEQASITEQPRRGSGERNGETSTGHGDYFGPHNNDCFCCCCCICECHCDQHHCCCCRCDDGGCYSNCVERSCCESYFECIRGCCDCIQCKWNCCDGCCDNCQSGCPSGHNCNEAVCHCHNPCCACLERGCCEDGCFELCSGGCDKCCCEGCDACGACKCCDACDGCGGCDGCDCSGCDLGGCDLGGLNF